MDGTYQVFRWVVMVVTYDTNKHYRNFSDFDEAVAYCDDAFDDPKVIDAYIFEKTNY